MDLNYSPEDREFRATTRRWLESNIPKQELKTLDDRKAWHRKLYEAGYVGMLWPKEYGGWGATPMQQAIVQDEMARVSSPPAINGLGIGFIGPTIIVHGTEAQKKRYLKKMLTAEEIWCQLYSEPNAGSDLASLKTRAEDQGDHFVVNGQKIWTSSGPIADWGILLCRTDAKVAKHHGISCVLLNMRQPGVEVRPLKQITGSSLFSEVFMTNARADKSDLIGEHQRGLGDRADDARLRARRQRAGAGHAVRHRVRPAREGHEGAQARRQAADRGPGGARPDGTHLRRPRGAALRGAARALGAAER